MGGSMARKESRAPNGHPAELKKEGETAVQQLAVRRSLLLWGPAYLREHLGFPQKAQKTCRRSNAAPQKSASEKRKAPYFLRSTVLSGGDYRDRTGDLLHAMQALSQLS